jgi:2-enoate reductase
MKQEYEILFTPWKIGKVEIKNRIVMCSMGGTSLFGWMEPNHFDKEAANFLLERAKNNVGLLLPGIAPIRDTMGGRWLYQNKAKFHKLREYMDEFHKTGAKLFIQLTAGMAVHASKPSCQNAKAKCGTLGNRSRWDIYAPTPPDPNRG